MRASTSFTRRLESINTGAAVRWHYGTTSVTSTLEVGTREAAHTEVGAPGTSVWGGVAASARGDR